MSRSEQESYALNKARVEELERRKERVRQLNDDFRTTLSGGRCVITPGVKALGADTLQSILWRISAYEGFTAGNDAHDEHDFGSLELGLETIFWKIDCYDNQLEFGSPDPSEPGVTARVLTIMLAHEY